MIRNRTINDVNGSFTLTAILIAALILCLSAAVSCGQADSDDDDDDDAGDDSDGQDDDQADDDDEGPAYDPPRITDDQGRQLILRGCNYMGMEFGWYNHSPEDFERIRSWGFNVVRLPIAWALLEPEQGEYDLSYLEDQVDRIVGYAADAGLDVIIDMHQWQWSPCFNGNGIPAWTCEGRYENNLVGWQLAAADFWRNPEYVEGFLNAYETVVERYADWEGVIGFDLFNEPHAGPLTFPQIFDVNVLQPLYARLIEITREYDQDAWIFFEPSIWHGGFPCLLDPLPDDRVVFAPHIYAVNQGQGDIGYNGDPAPLIKDYQKCADEGLRLGAPVLVGELGAGTATENAPLYFRDHLALLEAHLFGFTIWCYWRDENGMGLLYNSGEEKAWLIDLLSRPYPRATAGVLLSYEFNPASKAFAMSFESRQDIDGPTEIFVPASRHYPNGFDVICNDPEGEWSYEWDADQEILTIETSDEVKVHGIRIEPK